MVTAIAREENGEFCITVSPVTSTVGISMPTVLVMHPV